MSPMTPIRVIVFDWDGTLMDSTGPIVDALSRAVQDLGREPPSRKAAAALIGLVPVQMARRLLPDLDEAGVQRFMDRYRHHYLSLDTRPRPYAGIEALLDDLALAPVWLAIATGMSRVGLLRALETLGWQGGARRRFASLRCGDDGAPKPHPWMLQDLGEELGLRADEMLMVGDTVHDLGMARAAGVAAIAIGHGAQPQEQLEAFVASAADGDPPVQVVSDVNALRAALFERIGPF